jgi:hypothetical protein
MKLNKQFFKFFLILYLIHVVFILIFGELDFLSWGSSFDSNNDIFVYKYAHGLDFYLRFKYLYIYYFITVCYLTICHTLLFFVSMRYKNKIIKIIFYLLGIIILSYVFYCIYLNSISIRVFWYFIDDVFYYYFIEVCIFMIINLIFTKIYFNYYKISKE